MRDVESANGKYPERGQCLRDLFYVAVDGERKSISDFKSRSNLVVILTDNLDERLLDAIAQSCPEVTLREADVITVLKCKATARPALFRDSAPCWRYCDTQRATVWRTTFTRRATSDWFNPLSSHRMA